MGFAAVWAIAVKAGTIASSRGRLTVAPRPRRNVRRGSDIFVTIMAKSSLEILRVPGSSHHKRVARRDADDEGRELELVSRGAAHNASNHRHIVILDAASERVREQLLGERRDELLWSSEQLRLEPGEVPEGRSVG